ncbi:unnamed protein product [Caenorhabditis auriculariae]|uniref:Uncharacterized protein n=1 Tax=Caenorhabditis auriculariae TaxID=2777116 RepID=A0A8S1HU43_9PELO|nr:unnamed protein product [Caenorhabditis auriculariae]
MDGKGPELSQFDHRHLQMYRWLHNSSLTDNSETSVETSMESSFGSIDASVEMPRPGDSPMSRMLPSSISSFVALQTAPSTSFAHAIPDWMAPLQFFPTTYTPPAHHAHSAAQLLLLHNMVPQQVVEPDIDVVGLSDSTKEVSLVDKDEEPSPPTPTNLKSPQNFWASELVDEQQRNSFGNDSDEEEDLPLDLSLKHPSLASPSCSRPSVIIDGAAPKSHTTVRRSMSSASSYSGGSTPSTTSSTTNVEEHFRRSLSGKWPRRAKTEDEKARSSPLRRRTSFNVHTSVSSLQTTPCSSTTVTVQPATSPQTPIIVNNTCSDTSLSIANHFRRALSGKGLSDWQKKRGEKH